MAEHGDAVATGRPLPTSPEILTALRGMWEDPADPPIMLGDDEAKPLRNHPGYAQSGPDTLNPYWETVGWLPAEHHSTLGIAPPIPKASMMTIRRRTGPVFAASRDLLVWTYAWSIPSPGDLAFIIAHLGGRGVVEMGAGTGYWAWQLAQAGVDVIAYDAQPGGNEQAGPTCYHPVQVGKPADVAAHGDRALLLCWPPGGDPMAADTLAAYPGDTLIYVGEFNAYTNADATFFARLNLDRDWELVAMSRYHVNFYGIYCNLAIFTRINPHPNHHGEARP